MAKIRVPKYNYKYVEELCWMLLVALVPVFIQYFSGFDPDAIKDWTIWRTALIAALVRAAVAALLAWYTKIQVSD